MIESKPLISIIVPVYNVELYLEKCVQSLSAQSYFNIEIILVNDGSLDNSGMLCDELSKLDKRIRVVHKENGGLSDARNAGLATCRGDYIAFVDSDDFVHPDYIQILYEIIADADISVCDFEDFESEDSIIELQPGISIIAYSRERYLNELTNLSNTKFVVAWNKLYKRSLWINHRFVKAVLHEDEFAIHHIIDQCQKIHSSDEKLYYYRHRPNSITSSKRNKISFLDKLAAYYDRYLFFQDKGMVSASNAMLIQILNRCALPTVEKDNRIWQKLNNLKLIFKQEGLTVKVRMVLIIKSINYPVYRFLVSMI